MAVNIIKVMSNRSVNLLTLFLSRLRPPKRLNSTKCTYFRTRPFASNTWISRNGRIDETFIVWSFFTKVPSWVGRGGEGEGSLQSDALPTARKTERAGLWKDTVSMIWWYDTRIYTCNLPVFVFLFQNPSDAETKHFNLYLVLNITFIPIFLFDNCHDFKANHYFNTLRWCTMSLSDSEWLLNHLYVDQFLPSVRVYQQVLQAWFFFLFVCKRWKDIFVFFSFLIYYFWVIYIKIKTIAWSLFNILSTCNCINIAVFSQKTDVSHLPNQSMVAISVMKLWPWKLGQGYQNLISCWSCPIYIGLQIW